MNLHEQEIDAPHLQSGLLWYLSNFWQASDITMDCVKQLVQALALGHSFLEIKNADRLQALRLCPSVCLAEETDSPNAEHFKNRGPLVLSADKLYLAINYQDESDIANLVQGRLLKVPLVSALQEQLQAYLQAWFPDGGKQNEVALAALSYKFILLSGGPGTGKTTALARLLSLQRAWQMLQRPEEGLRIALAAPSGKAAQRMKESLDTALSTFKTQQDGAFPTELQGIDHFIAPLLQLNPSTLHRLLGISSIHPKSPFNQKNPLDVDLVVIDESSMVDLSLFAQLLRALSANTRLILLGDHDQLASVEAGSVFGDLCQAIPQHPRIHLTKSHRFSSDSGIGRLAQAIRMGETQKVIASLNSPPDCQQLAPESLKALLESILPFARALQNVASPTEGLKLLEQQIVLCANNRGPWGQETVNNLIHQSLTGPLLRGPLKGDSLKVQPILITHNSPDQDLFNGDVGLIMLGPHGKREAFFYDSSRNVRSLNPKTLPEHQSAFAFTIHKSQGSEYDSVYILIEESQRNLSRQLLYTAVTRAKKQVFIVASDQTIVQAVQTPSLRASDLKNRIG